MDANFYLKNLIIQNFAAFELVLLVVRVPLERRGVGAVGGQHRCSNAARMESKV